MTTIKTKYLGNLRTEMTHVQSGNKIITDAPLDNNGKGEFFSPTDMVAGALGSCMLTIMGMTAERYGVDLTGSEIEIEKIMYAEPRRIGEVKLIFTLPEKYDEKIMKILERSAMTCPVFNTLAPETKHEVIFKVKGTTLK